MHCVPTPRVLTEHQVHTGCPCIVCQLTLCAGFGFVSFSNKEKMENAIERLDGSDLDGRSISVNVAQPKTRCAVCQ